MAFPLGWGPRTDIQDHRGGWERKEGEGMGYPSTGWRKKRGGRVRRPRVFLLGGRAIHHPEKLSQKSLLKYTRGLSTGFLKRPSITQPKSPATPRPTLKFLFYSRLKHRSCVQEETIKKMNVLKGKVRSKGVLSLILTQSTVGYHWSPCWLKVQMPLVLMPWSKELLFDFVDFSKCCRLFWTNHSSVEKSADKRHLLLVSIYISVWCHTIIIELCLLCSHFAV